MVDLSEEPKDQNIALTKKYLERAAPMKQWLEMEIGITGGEEDGVHDVIKNYLTVGVDNTSVDNSRLYTQPEDIWDVYSALSQVAPYFSIAAGLETFMVSTNRVTSSFNQDS
jgi:fructose-bisphosphate aldolase class II